MSIMQSFCSTLLLVILVALPWNHTARADDALTAPLAVADLASDSAWTLAVDDGPTRAIKVPGGGYNSDRQDQPWIDQFSVKDHVLYQRTITIPKVRDDQATLVEFGAVNHGAEVYLVDGPTEKLVATHAGPMMPFSADLTALVTPGKTYGLKVKSFPAWHYGKRVPKGFIYEEAWKNPPKGWASRLAFGISKFVRLAIYPPVRIRDVFVRTSVTRAELTAEVWVHNHTARPQTLTVEGQLSSWNHDAWDYPPVPTTPLTIPANGDARALIGPIRWNLGPQSFWWPNKPFREDYQAKLHLLNLQLHAGAPTLHQGVQRFGFVEWTEGPFYYMVNGVRINFISDATPEDAMSDYDSYSTAPAFLPPTQANTGCPETWRCYMRLSICANRIHQSTPTPYMMDAADEVGFMLIPETAIRCNQEQWDDVHLPDAVRELAQACRSHPSVCRYSLQNESTPAWAGPLGDAIVTVDDTRPLVFEDNQQKHPGVIFGNAGTHAYCMIHYEPHPKPAQMITGVGECAWNGSAGENDHPFLEQFAAAAADGRRWDIAYYSGWDWINYWPNFLQGMNAQRHAWKQQYHHDRQDGVDGWNSPVIRWVQKCFHPFLVMDEAFQEANGPFTAAWPARIPTYGNGQSITRIVDVFNDDLSGENLTLRWAAHWDKPDGPVVASGTHDLIIKPGFHARQPITFTAPGLQSPAPRRLYLILESVKNKQTVFRQDDVYFTITDHPTVKLDDRDPAITYTGTWHQFTGNHGYEDRRP